MTPVEMRAQRLIELARNLRDDNPDCDLGAVVRIVCAADELTDIRNNIPK
jgi:hypothetical protein